MLLRGLLFTPDGEQLMPTYTVKKGKKAYRYYTPSRDRRFGAWASRFGSFFGSFCQGITRSSTGQNPAWRGGFRQEKGLGDYPSP